MSGSLLETTISKKVTPRLELGGGLPAIEADVAQAQQVVMNRVINGAEAIGD
jgi:nitrogen-specific signal transduction histidine kinase